jgi:hypothetical protein
MQKRGEIILFFGIRGETILERGRGAKYAAGHLLLSLSF